MKQQIHCITSGLAKSATLSSRTSRFSLWASNIFPSHLPGGQARDQASSLSNILLKRNVWLAGRCWTAVRQALHFVGKF